MTAHSLVGAALQKPLEAEAHCRVSLSTSEPLAEVDLLAQWSHTTATQSPTSKSHGHTLAEIYLALTGSTIARGHMSKTDTHNQPTGDPRHGR